MLTIRQVLQQNKEVAEPDLLLGHVLRKPQEFLYINPGFTLTPTQFSAFTKLCERRKNGEPIAYILGYKYFYGLKFKVNKHVLVPRPETEWLVERALALVESRKSIKSKVSILDVGTGSGCIAISLAHSLTSHESRVTTSIIASDISPTALEVAAQNAKAHKVNVEFVQSDLFKNVRGKFDIVIANLPYVPQGMYELLYHNLKYEPKVAITDGGEVWDIYQKFFAQLPKHLKPGGTALLEIDDGSKPDMQKMIHTLLPGWHAKFSKDLGGLWRHLELQRA